MEIRRIYVVETVFGVSLVVVGFVLAWWSRQLMWIEIYPPPWEKQFIESLPLMFWGFGASLTTDGLRRIFSIRLILSMSKQFFLLLFYAVLIALLSLFRSEHFPLLDFDHWKYGYPLFWLINQTSSIMGAENKWFIDLQNLFVNFAFWLPMALFCTCLTLVLIGLRESS